MCNFDTDKLPSILTRDTSKHSMCVWGSALRLVSHWFPNQYTNYFPSFGGVLVKLNPHKHNMI